MRAVTDKGQYHMIQTQGHLNPLYASETLQIIKRHLGTGENSRIEKRSCRVRFLISKQTQLTQFGFMRKISHFYIFKRSPAAFFKRLSSNATFTLVNEL